MDAVWGGLGSYACWDRIQVRCTRSVPRAFDANLRAHGLAGRARHQACAELRAAAWLPLALRWRAFLYRRGILFCLQEDFVQPCYLARARALWQCLSLLGSILLRSAPRVCLTLPDQD